ncbi:MAG TPA: phosphatase PAP2 family protein [Gemmatimonadaceae bacterium]
MTTRRFALAVIALAIAIPARHAHAQTVVSMLGTDIKNSVGDAWDVWTSPLRGHASDWLLAGGSLAVSAAVSPADPAVDRWAVRNQNSSAFDFLEPIREGGVAFSGKTITPVALGALAIGLATKNERLQDGLFGCLTAYAASSVVRNYVMYPLVARTRPDSGRSTESPPAKNGDQYKFDFPGSSNWGEHSFPGGHVANVAACAEFLTRRFSMGIAEPLPWIVVGGVALSRTLDRRHWASDQVIGTIFGYAVGKEVALRSSRRAAKAKARVGETVDDRGTLFLSPDPTGALRLGWRKAF